jgi:hypothetical protein
VQTSRVGDGKRAVTTAKRATPARQCDEGRRPNLSSFSSALAQANIGRVGNKAFSVMFFWRECRPWQTAGLWLSRGRILGPGACVGLLFCRRERFAYPWSRSLLMRKPSDGARGSSTAGLHWSHSMPAPPQLHLRHSVSGCASHSHRLPPHILSASKRLRARAATRSIRWQPRIVWAE